MVLSLAVINYVIAVTILTNPLQITKIQLNVKVEMLVRNECLTMSQSTQTNLPIAPLVRLVHVINPNCGSVQKNVWWK